MTAGSNTMMLFPIYPGCSELRATTRLCRQSLLPTRTLTHRLLIGTPQVFVAGLVNEGVSA